MRSIKTPRTRTRTKNRLSIPDAQFVVAILLMEFSCASTTISIVHWKVGKNHISSPDYN